MLLSGNNSPQVGLERTFEARLHVTLNDDKPAGHFPFPSKYKILSGS
jgi:hypothetical protein